uniref:Single tm domain protein n=1 Tax=Parastrongyloides trichosuri TaxID=131310 RepID=A0A0N4ZG13_PARTI
MMVVGKTSSEDLESGSNAPHIKTIIPTYEEAMNSSEFNDIIRNHRYSRIQYIIPSITQQNYPPPQVTQYSNTEDVSRDKKVGSKIIALSILLIIMIPAVYILVVIVTNITPTKY